MLGNTADAQDVVQEGFIKLLNSRFRGESKLATYFHTLIARLCLDRLRSPGRAHEVWDEDHVTEDPSPNPEQTLALHQSADQVQQALMHLPPRQRLALNLWAHHDASVADIAHTLDIPTNAAHQLLRLDEDRDLGGVHVGQVGAECLCHSDALAVVRCGRPGGVAEGSRCAFGRLRLAKLAMGASRRRRASQSSTLSS